MPSNDKAAIALYHREWYKKNRQKKLSQTKDRNYKQRAFLRRFANRVRRFFGCNHCGMKIVCCLDFHHVGDKIQSVCVAVGRAWSIERVKEEMRKCIILCSNCHRIETSRTYSNNS